MAGNWYATRVSLLLRIAELLTAISGQTDDFFWVVVLAAGPSLLTILTVPSNTSTASHSHRRTYNLLTPGIHMFSHPMVEDASMRAEMIRDGNCVALCDPFEESGFKFDASPKTYNFNAFVCRSR